MTTCDTSPRPPHVSRPEVDTGSLTPGAPPPEGAARAIPALRLQRKRLAATCLFLVLVAAILGVRLLVQFGPLVAAIVVLAAAALSWRAFRTGVRYGYV